MTSLYADARWLKLETGNEVAAFVQNEPKGIERPKCLLLHGNPGSLLDWGALVPRLSNAADIAAIDLPGFGRSRRTAPGAQALSLDRLAEQAIFAANALDWREPIVLVGHSHGGAVAQTVAARYPARVAGLVLIASLGAPAQANYRLLSLPGAASFARLVGRLFRSQGLRSLKRAILEQVMIDIFSPEPVPAQKLDHELAQLSSRPEILVSMVQVTCGQPCAQLLRCAPEIQCPTLFIHGREDALVPAKYARAIHDQMLKAGRHSQFELVPGAGHMLVDYQSAELAQLILGSLNLRNSSTNGHDRAESS